MGIIIVLALFGLIVGLLAKNRGRSFGIWFIYGALLFLIAFIHVLCLKDDSKICSSCKSRVDTDAKVCKFCRHKFTKEEFAVIEKKKKKEEKHNETMFGVMVAIFGIAIVIFYLAFHGF